MPPARIFAGRGTGGVPASRWGRGGGDAPAGRGADSGTAISIGRGTGLARAGSPRHPIQLPASFDARADMAAPTSPECARAQATKAQGASFAGASIFPGSVSGSLGGGTCVLKHCVRTRLPVARGPGHGRPPVETSSIPFRRSANCSLRRPVRKAGSARQPQVAVAAWRGLQDASRASPRRKLPHIWQRPLPGESNSSCLLHKFSRLRPAAFAGQALSVRCQTALPLHWPFNGPAGGVFATLLAGRDRPR